jgi:glutamate/tyrosine decarboxylase-like PLP-dependent enzyme
MIKRWAKSSLAQVRKTIFKALGENISFLTGEIMGLPVSHLDKHVFNHKAAKKAPFLKALVENPNHIGCHTLKDVETEPFFKGTQKIELKALQICAENILGAAPDSYDGYIASGGTESNIQAIWMFRNYYKKNYHLKNHEVGVLFSRDTHYSVYKACDILGTTPFSIEVDSNTREFTEATFRASIAQLKREKITHVVLVLNMGTTMFGIVDDIDMPTKILEEEGIDYKVHVDAAFGGFIYPFLCPDNKLSFENPKVLSVSMDAHKMLQAPYGTGVFLTRKGIIEYTYTETAKYVVGGDFTLVGSRSGATSVAVWMILKRYGSDGMQLRMDRIKIMADEMCAEIESLNIPYLRNHYMNIVAIPHEYVRDDIASRFSLVPDDHDHPTWWKVVLMGHISPDLVHDFIEA